MKRALAAISIIFFFRCLSVEEILEYKRLHSIDYVTQKYEVNVHGIDCLFYPAKTPKRLWIFFNGATVGRYTMWSWFWRDNEDWQDTAYLFLKDDQIRWYFGTDDKPLTQTYCDIITHFMHVCGLSIKQIYTIGHSMGGYAALYFGIYLQVGGIFAIRPQVDWYNAARFFSVKKLRHVWVDIHEFTLRATSIPPIFVQFGNFAPDKDAGTLLVNALMQKKSFVIVQKTNNETHVGYNPNKQSITKTLLFMQEVFL